MEWSERAAATKWLGVKGVDEGVGVVRSLMMNSSGLEGVERMRWYRKVKCAAAKGDAIVQARGQGRGGCWSDAACVTCWRSW